MSNYIRALISVAHHMELAEDSTGREVLAWVRSTGSNEITAGILVWLNIEDVAAMIEW